MEKRPQFPGPVQIGGLQNGVRYRFKGSRHDKDRKCGPYRRQDQGQVGVQQSEPVQDQIIGNLRNLKWQDHQQDIQEKQGFLRRERETGEGPCRRGAHQELAGQGRNDLDTGVPEHDEEARRAEQQLDKRLKGRIRRKQRRVHGGPVRAQRLGVAVEKLVLGHQGCGKQQKDRQPDQQADRSTEDMAQAGAGAEGKAKRLHREYPPLRISFRTAQTAAAKSRAALTSSMEPVHIFCTSSVRNQ